MARYDFASDNTAGAAPEAIASLAEHNAGDHLAYHLRLIEQPPH